jgi:hypothetical protein
VSVHWLSLKLPASLLNRLNRTVPVGVLAVPAEVSVTVAVHVVDLPTATGLGEQLTVVLAERGSTVTAWLPLLSAWVESPP